MLSTGILTRRQLEVINRRSLNYPLPAAEKDYYLALAAKTVVNSVLQEKLILKGGTGLHHCYLDQYRFSEDLDFSSLDKDITLEVIINTLEATKLFTVKKDYVSDSTIKIERLQYHGLLGQPKVIPNVKTTKREK